MEAGYIHTEESGIRRETVAIRLFFYIQCQIKFFFYNSCIIIIDNNKNYMCFIHNYFFNDMR